MAVRQYALHFNLSEGCIVFLSSVVSFLLVFAFGVYIGKEVQAFRTAQETRTVRFPVKSPDDRVYTSPSGTASPAALTKSTDQSAIKPSSSYPATGQDPHLSVKTALKKKPESSPEVSSQAKNATPDKKEQTQSAGRWSIQVHVTKRRSSAQQLAAELRKQGHVTSVNTLTKNGEVLYRLRVGTFSQEDAQRVAARFRRDGKFTQAYLVSE